MSSRFYPAARPRPVAGGLKARSARGAIAKTWWAERFLTVLESAGMGSRLQRGKTYARKGQVVSLDVDAAMVTAVVQGSRARPYRVRIGTATFGKVQWTEVERELAKNAWYLAKLLAGEMPEDIEDVFIGLGLDLFPAGAVELSMDCSCPDWEVPCKHLAAAFYLLAESFDDDPFRIFAWRGRTREDLLDNLHAASGGAYAADADESPDVPLADLLDSFFALQSDLPSPAASASAGLLAQVPPVDVVVRGRGLTELLVPAYQALDE